MHLHALRLMTCVNHVAHLVADPAPITAWVAITAYAPGRNGDRSLRFLSGTANFGWDLSKVKPGDPLEFGIKGGTGRAHAVFLKRPNLLMVCDSGIAALQLAGALRARDAATLAALAPYVKGEASGELPALELPPLFATESLDDDDEAVIHRTVTEDKPRAARLAEHRALRAAHPPSPFVMPPAPPTAAAIAPLETSGPVEWPEPVPLLREAPRTPLGGFVGCITKQQAAAARVKAAKAGLDEDTLTRICRTYLGVPEVDQVRRGYFGRLMDELIPRHAAPDNQLATYRLKTQAERDVDAFNRITQAWQKSNNA